MKKLVSNLKVSQKLSFITSAFVVPILILLYFLISEQNIRIDFAQKEIYGDQYLRPLKELMELAPELKFVHHCISKGEAEYNTKYNSLQDEINNIFTQLVNVDSELTDYLTTTSHLNSLKSNWSKLKSTNIYGSEYDNFISEIRGMISYVGDMSNLILDPDLDSYYIMDATLLKLPENMDLIYQILDYGNDIVQKNSITPDEKTVLTVKSGLLRTNTAALLSGVNVAFDNNPAENLRSSLSDGLSKTVKETNTFLDDIDKYILNSESIELSESDFKMEAFNSLNANFIFWDQAIDDLDMLLEARIAGFNSSKYITLTSVFVVLIISLFFVLLISKNISNSISILANAAHDYYEGKPDIKVQLHSNDELGKLADMFNQMMDKINDSIHDVIEQKKDVEQKIELAIKESKAKNRYLAESVEKMLKGIQKFAEGDLTVELEILDNDEIGRLYNGFNDAIRSIKELIISLNNAIQSTVKTSLHISESSSNITRGMEKEALQANEVASAVEEMTATILNTTQNTVIASETSNKAGQIAKDGGTVVNKTIEGMNKIAEVVKRSASTVQKLGRNSDQIGEIIQVIDDIADQTNLLALNAAIEAARAGEQGRGFAVVADEVRKLAERTTKATKEIANMIKQIQRDTYGAVEAMDEGTKEVESGIELANKAGKSLQEIIDVSIKVADIVSQVATASEEQSSAANQIDHNIEGINTIIIENSSGIGEITRSADELNELTQDLNNLIARFRIYQHSDSMYNEKSYHYA